MTFQQRVFKSKVDNNILDVSVTILVDYSGSMGGSKMQSAMKSGVILNDCLSKIGIPFELLGFTDARKQVYYIFKTFDKKVSKEELANRLVSAEDYTMSGNADGEAIMFAYDRLARRKEKRKILLVLSDGSPAGGRGGNITAYTKQVIGNIESHTRVEIMGIGIEDSNVKKLYKNHDVIKSSSELESKLLNVLKNSILN